MYIYNTGAYLKIYLLQNIIMQRIIDVVYMKLYTYIYIVRYGIFTMDNVHGTQYVKYLLGKR